MSGHARDRRTVDTRMELPVAHNVVRMTESKTLAQGS